MVVDEEPVAHVEAAAVELNRLFLERVEDAQRDELFGEMERTVIVGAVGDDDRQTVGRMPGTHEMV